MRCARSIRRSTGSRTCRCAGSGGRRRLRQSTVRPEPVEGPGHFAQMASTSSARTVLEKISGRVPFRLRIFFRGAFALLALATIALALTVLVDEKQRSHRRYAEGLHNNLAQIAARLRHPTGQLALLNPELADQAPTPLHPLVLPFSAIDFDDRVKSLQAVEMAGCQVQYPDGSSWCAGVGNNPYAGAFVYLVGSVALGEL